MLTLLVHYWPYSNSHHCGYAMMDLSVALVMTNRASCTPMENLPDITKSSRYHAILALRLVLRSSMPPVPLPRVPRVDCPGWRTGTTNRGWSFASRESGFHHCESLGMDREWTRHWPCGDAK
mmetsp:Transcript_8306/g.14649  ORF Transcript_8306/g.14649 Transcript_8306/m.14649 type:complete len:122 (-) Transcript_8306:31-396(-)